MSHLRRRAKAPAAPHRPTQPHPSSSPRSLPSVFKLVSLTPCILVAYLLYIYNRHDPTPSSPSSSALHHDPSEYVIPAQSDALAAINTAIKNSWLAYANSPAWGSDDFYVLSQTGGNLTEAGSIAFFIVDVLDTILLTGEMDEEYQRCRRYVQDDLSFDVDGKLNAFEVTIRVLGGLLSAYYLSGNDTVYLEKAIDLGNRLLPIFDSPTGIPYSFINLKTGEATADSDNYGLSSLAEATTLQLEFKYLAEVSQNRVFWDVAEKAMMPFRHAPSYNGLLPILVSPETASFRFNIRLGSRGDSYYEYLIKQYLQTNRTQVTYKEMYDKAITGVKEELLRQTPNGLMYIGELHPRHSSYTFVPKQDHLVCFLGGTLLLGVTEGNRVLNHSDVLNLSDQAQQDWLLGQELINTCVNTYQASKTGLGPEIAYFTERPEHIDWVNQREWFIHRRVGQHPPVDARNILRPETVESLFFGWRATKDPIYRKWGWQIFQAFNKHCKVETTGAFASIYDVDQIPTQLEDRMETFWLAETLKYFLLLFSDDSVVPLNSHVLNTEAHIFPIFTPSFESDM